MGCVHSPTISFSSRLMVSSAGRVVSCSGKSRNWFRDRSMARRCCRELTSLGSRCRQFPSRRSSACGGEGSKGERGGGRDPASGPAGDAVRRTLPGPLSQGRGALRGPEHACSLIRVDLPGPRLKPRHWGAKDHGKAPPSAPFPALPPLLSFLCSAPSATGVTQWAEAKPEWGRTGAE